VAVADHLLLLDFSHNAAGQTFAIMAEQHQKQGRRGQGFGSLSMQEPQAHSHAPPAVPACAKPNPDRPKTIPQVKLEQELEMQRRKEEANCNMRFVANKVL
jgi:hypothetical protein